ncbi:MAG: alpha-glucuronidase family glycosyl hydrolase [Terriglobales bacterium]
MRHPHIAILVAVLLGGWALETAHAGTGGDAWLRYAPLESTVRAKYESLPSNVVLLGDSVVLRSAQGEMIRGITAMTGRAPDVEKDFQKTAIILGTLDEIYAVLPKLVPPRPLGSDDFWLVAAQVRGFDCLIVTSPTDRGVLYGVFSFLRKVALGENLAALNELQQPHTPIRWVDQWDNLNGTIERGYAGPSIFFEKGSVRAELTRAGEYARLLASVGITGCTVNNVNADPRIIDGSFLPQLARIADAFRPWGVQLAVSVDLSSPKILGNLDSFDPLDPRVIEWWRAKVDKIYQQIPDFGGFVVKADSEGRAGPSSYGRTPADAANVIARALKPHGGILFYRAFVYDHHLDWRNPKNDRARAAYDTFHPLDGKFDDNVIVQIKYGPIDFQAREPVSPLFSGMEKTNQGIELQITQEYTGQQRHLVFLPTMWKEILDFDPRVNGEKTPVKDLVAGKVFHRPAGAFVGVANVGMGSDNDPNWLGHPLAMANLYGFGRLAWDPNLSAETIAEEWTRLTFGDDPVVVKTIAGMLLASWHTYENYTGPLGAQTLTDILGSHYGPGIESSERNGWGQWHRADHDGIGMDRTVATGTGFTGQYPPEVRNLYESVQTTPDELLLFFHHVPYTYRLHSGKTVIQYIYDSHYEGSEQAADFVRQWKTLKHRLPDGLYADVLSRLEYQAGHAIVWRDAIGNWFLRTSEIPDAKGRVGNHTDRIEAESMSLKGYAAMDVTPWENASGGKGIECPRSSPCTASFRFDRPAGLYEMDVQYFDQNNGESKFRVLVGDRQVDEWIANDHLPATKPGGDSSTRHRIPGLTLRPGDEIRIEGVPDGEERAPLDYVELHAATQ